MNEKKDLPSTEYSLKSISWHLKTLVEEAKKIREALVEEKEKERAWFEDKD